MDAYTGFASVYDQLMDNIPYPEWAEYIASILREYQIKDGLVLDLCCGTGMLTRLLAKAGYDMIGVDLSEDMLQVAREREDTEPQSILYLNQDMRAFELYGTVKAVVCACDSINYLLQYEELVTVFSLVNNYLDPGGIFIFDCNTIYKYETILADQIIAEDRDCCSFIWENYYDPSDQINEYVLSLFIQSQGKLYEKHQEIHYQKAYSLAQIRQALEQSGLTFVAAYDALTRNPPRADSERIYLIAGENGKQKEKGSL